MRTQETATYTITVNQQSYVVQVDEGGDVTQITAPVAAAAPQAAAPVPSAGAEPMNAPLAGNIWKIHAKAGEAVEEGDVLLILEAMKMETEIRAPRAGTIARVDVTEGDAVDVGTPLLELA